jgi:predicted nucleotidyltransferase
MVAMSDILELSEQIVREFQPERIILFGSHAYGRPSPDSDVDLLIIIPHQGKNWELASRIRGTVRPGFPVDFLVRSPGQLQRRLAMRDSFIQEIMSHGKILYDARRS